jgi:hypothetical protein
LFCFSSAARSVVEPTTLLKFFHASSASSPDSLIEDPYTRVARAAGEKIGTIAGRLRSIDSERVAEGVKGFVARHPSAVFGVAMAGFLFGRLIRRR